eukprot:Pgem_evm1s4185
MKNWKSLLNSTDKTMNMYNNDKTKVTLRIWDGESFLSCCDFERFIIISSPSTESISNNSINNNNSAYAYN